MTGAFFGKRRTINGKYDGEAAYRFNDLTVQRFNGSTNMTDDRRPMTDAFPGNGVRRTGNVAAKPLINLTVQRFNGLTNMTDDR